MKKKLFSVMLGLLALIVVFTSSAFADGSKKSGLFTYEIKGNGTAVITGFNWNANGNEDIYIPRMLDGYTVTGIGDNAFSNAPQSEPLAVILPDTITTIGEKAFFKSEGVASINIPVSVQSIGYGAFANCGKEIIFSVAPGSATFATIEGVLYNKQLKEMIACPRGINSLNIPEGIISIGDYACYNCSTDITFPSTLTQIGNYAFSMANIGSCTLPNSLMSIGEYAFSDAKWYTQVNVNNYLMDVLCIPQKVSYIGEGAFMNCALNGHRGYDALILSNCEITEIPKKAFENVDFYYDNKTFMAAKTSVLKWPKNLETIGAMAFKDSRLGLTTLPKGIKQIEERAFENAYFAKGSPNGMYAAPLREQEFTIPDGVMILGKKAFTNCDLETLVLPNTLSDIGDDICDRTKTILKVDSGSYAALWASENGYPTTNAGGDDTSWLNS